MQKDTEIATDYFESFIGLSEGKDSNIDPSEISQAYYELGNIFYQENDEKEVKIRQDLDKAMNYFSKAIDFDENNADANFALGIMYLTGQAKQSQELAMKHFETAAHLGNSSAKYELGKFAFLISFQFSVKFSFV